MTLTSQQLTQLVENYAERIIDEMDTKTLMQFAYDTIVDNMMNMGPEDVLNEISGVYDEEILQELVDGVTVQ